MSRMPHAPGGMLPPLGLRIAQKKVAPADLGHSAEKKELSCPSSGSCNSFTKVHPKAETLLHNHFNSAVKRDPLHHLEAARFDDGDNEDNLIRSPLPSSGAYIIQVERSIAGLRKCLAIHKGNGAEPLKGFFKQASTDSSLGEFYYHPAYASIGQHGSRLHVLTQHRHYLKLAKDYALRLKSSWDFTQKLAGMVVTPQASATLQDILTWARRLKALCEELRTNSSHWSALQKRIRRDHWLRPLLLQKEDTLIQMKNTLSQLACQAIELMERHLESSLRYLGCVGVTRLSPEELSDVFRGVEIYNQVLSDTAPFCGVSECQQRTPEVLLNVAGPTSPLRKESMHRRARAYPISRMLSIIAEGRGHQAADRLHQYLLQQDVVWSSSGSASSLGSFDWKKAKEPSFQNLCHFVAGAKQPRKALCNPKGKACQPDTAGLSTSRHLEAICTEDEQRMRKLLDVLVSSTDTFWQHFLNKPKPDRPQSSECTLLTQHAQQSNGIYVADGDLEAIHAEGSLNMQGCSDRRLGTPTTEAVGVLNSRYQTVLWKYFRLFLLDRFYGHPVAAPSLSSMFLCKEEASIAVVQNLVDMLANRAVPEECVLEGRTLCLELLTRTVFICWDRGFCRALGSGLNDKCVPETSAVDGPVKSMTAGLLLELFPPLNFLLQCLHSRNFSNPGTAVLLMPLRLGVLSRCLSTLQSVCSWVMTKAYQFLASWSLHQLLLVTQADLVRFSSEVMHLFSDDCRRMSADLFLQTMPAAKHWRLRLPADIPSEPSEYATDAAQAVIGQMVQGVQPLSQDSQIAVLMQVIKVFMEAWMGHILKQKIKFSLQGALQLKQDFDMVRGMIQSRDSNLSQDVRQAILSQRVFQQVDNAIICLLQQPTSKSYMPSTTWDPFHNCCSCSPNEEFNSGSLNSLESLDIQTARNGAVLEAQTSATADLLSKMRSSSNPESYLMVNQQEWLALRLYSSRRWRVPALPCMKSTPEP
ncbi:coiled-coil domain-containing protein 142 isoform X2 [Ambystoma mexicanum]|uniref:coiled-coil domain-containing protein 142 isoform X2 n=1 Tax=Ambystoma mexicanum TaxID=8296 RepID=UPI0037E79518